MTGWWYAFVDWLDSLFPDNIPRCGCGEKIYDCKCEKKS